ncbi:Hypothetical predicted protein [Paramuricea clavata]|uniref:Uncharacterized protein n=1 Tax=Paramuricea clavata TaxID=317549 RepID=A0A6S7IQV5_PARCT|nr:Hypothetical predicted protein [Paramuricea clavata]
MINPFEYEEEELLHITSGTVATEEVEKDLQSAYDRGEAALIAICKERLQTREVDLLTSMKKLKLKTFTSMSKTTKSKVHGKEVSLKADRNLLARLVVIGRIRKVDLQELLSYSLGPVPLALCTSLGCLVKTNKAKMPHSLESQPEKAIVEIPRGGIYVVDAMATIQKVDVKKLPDTYRDQSIKNAERAKRAVGGSQVIRVYGQEIPLQWKKFLSCGKNKEALLQYLYDTWKTVNMCDVHGVKVYYAHGSKCDIFYAIPGNTADQIVEVHEVLELNSTQEEADTRLYLHVTYAANTCSDVIIVSPDIDVLVIGVSLQPLIAAHLYFHTGKGADLRTIDIKAIQESIGDDARQSFIGLHCFTGCESVSAFYGRGKTKAFNLLLNDKNLCSAFEDLGERFDLLPEMVVLLDKFVCK